MSLVFLEWREAAVWGLPSIAPGTRSAVAAWPLEGRGPEASPTSSSRPLAPRDGPPSWLDGEQREAAWSPELRPATASADVASLLASCGPGERRAVVWWRDEPRPAMGADMPPCGLVRVAVASFPCPASPRAGDGAALSAPPWLDRAAFPEADVLEVMSR